MAAQAGKAAPAMAIAGALVAAPTATTAASAAVKPAASTAHQPAKATLDSYKAAAVQNKATQHSAAKKLTANTSYTVQSGDTLAKIASNEYHKASDWQWLYHENASKISDPDDIYPGQSLNVPADPPAHYTLPSSEYQPKHAAAASTSGSDTVVTQSATSYGSSESSHASASAGGGSVSESGTLSCSGLEALWENAGGSSGEAEMAASIAMAESGGNQYAVSPTDDVGYWQINESNGSLATTDPYGNARAAIQLSGDGSNWGAWTTYASGAYEGKC